jgi:hypothetical protein
MREPVLIINEELQLRTFGCCEYHPCDVNRGQYEVFWYNGQQYYYTYRLPYRSYIAIDLDRFHRVEHLMDYLKKVEFRKNGTPNVLEEFKGKGDDVKITAHYELEASFLLGVLGFHYSYYGSRDNIYGRFSIYVTPFERQYIRQWEDWDAIRDKGWEYWLEILSLFTKEGA